MVKFVCSFGRRDTIVYVSRSHLWIVCFIALISTASSAHAGFTASGTWDANWVVGVNPFPTQQAGDADGSFDLSSGSDTAIVESPYKPGRIEVELSGTIGNTPKLTARNKIELTTDMKPQGENTPAPLMLHIKSEIQGDFSDTLTISNFPTEGGSLVVDMTWWGSYVRGLVGDIEAVIDYKIRSGGSLSVFRGAQQIGQITDPFAHEAMFDGTLFDTTGIPFNDTGGFFPSMPFQPASQAGAESQFRVPISGGQETVPFAINYTDQLSVEVDVRNPQRFAELFEMYAERNFLSTVDIRLGVEDLNGNLLEDAVISSAEGYIYDPIPEPASGALMLGIASIFLTRHRRRSQQFPRQ